MSAIEDVQKRLVIPTTENMRVDHGTGSSFTVEKVSKIWQSLSADKVVAAMAQALASAQGIPFEKSREISSTILEGEKGRTLLLSATYWPRFYEKPIHLLKARNLIGDNATFVELGPSLGIHWSILSQADRVGAIIGIEHQPHIVAGANVVAQALQKAGLWNSNISILQGDHLTQTEPADVAILSLVSQYDAGENGTVAWLMQHGKWGINGDVIHAKTRITREELHAGLFPIRSKRYPNLDTGVYWKLETPPVAYSGNHLKVSIADAHLVIDPNVIKDDGQIAYISLDGDSSKGRVTIYTSANGDLFYDGWAFKPKMETISRDEEEILALKEILSDIYQYLDAATQGERQWDGSTGIALPAYAASQGLYTALMMTTTNNAARTTNISGRLPIAIIMRHRQEAQTLYAQNLLSCVGQGKFFENLEQVYDTARKWLNPNSGLDSIVEYTQPILSTTITTSDKKLFTELIDA